MTIASIFIGFIAGVLTMKLLTPSQLPPDVSPLVDAFRENLKASPEAKTEKVEP